MPGHRGPSKAHERNLKTSTLSLKWSEVLEFNPCGRDLVLTEEKLRALDPLFDKKSITVQKLADAGVSSGALQFVMDKLACNAFQAGQEIARECVRRMWYLTADLVATQYPRDESELSVLAQKTIEYCHRAADADSYTEIRQIQYEYREHEHRAGDLAEARLLYWVISVHVETAIGEAVSTFMEESPGTLEEKEKWLMHRAARRFSNTRPADWILGKPPVLHARVGSKRQQDGTYAPTEAVMVAEDGGAG